MKKPKKTTNKLSVSKKKELEEWDEKVRNSNDAMEEAKKFSLNHILMPFDPFMILPKFAREVIPKLKIKDEKLSKGDNELMEQVAWIHAVENGMSMLEAVEERYRGMILNFRMELVKEYDCKTVSEKALVDMVVNAYARTLSLSKKLVHTAGKEYTSPNLNSFLSVMSKEVDRANRHFISSLETLRQIKQPELKVNVKAKNAFIGQNQQFNNKPNENNKAK